MVAIDGAVRGSRYATSGTMSCRRALPICTARLAVRVTLDRSLDWSGDSTYDLDDPCDLQMMYQTVLNQAAIADDLSRWLDADILRRVWTHL